MKTIFRAIVGSQAYGTSTPTSDVDKKGIYCQPIKDLIGFGYKEQIEYSKDHTEYEIRRFLQLAQSANPNILELLFSPKDCIEVSTPGYELLNSYKNRFLTTQCANSFGGYAIAQIKKAKDYNEYQEWFRSRNTQRYVDTVNGQQIDGKNLMHCRRLLDMAMEIATEGTINVRRPNREYLLSIRRGEISLEELLDKSEADIKRLDEMFAKSNLPTEVDKNWLNDLLLEIRSL